MMEIENYYHPEIGEALLAAITVSRIAKIPLYAQRQGETDIPQKVSLQHKGDNWQLVTEDLCFALAQFPDCFLEQFGAEVYSQDTMLPNWEVIWAKLFRNNKIPQSYLTPKELAFLTRHAHLQFESVMYGVKVINEDGESQFYERERIARIISREVTTSDEAKIKFRAWIENNLEQQRIVTRRWLTALCSDKWERVLEGNLVVRVFDINDEPTFVQVPCRFIVSMDELNPSEAKRLLRWLP